MYERFYQLRERPFALSPGSGLSLPEPRPPRGARLPALRHREPGRVRRHHRRDRLGQDDAAPDAAARPRQPDDGRADREHDARAARAARDDHDRLRPRSAGPQQAGDAARPGAVSGRSAARRPAGAAGDRRGAEPRASARSKSCGCCRTSRPRNRSCCRSSWSASRTCATSWRRPSSSSCGSGLPSAITCAPLDADETGQLHQPPAAPRRPRRAAGVPARRDRRDPRAQPRRAAHHQRHLRRRAGLRLRRRAPPGRPARSSPTCSSELETTGVLPAGRAVPPRSSASAAPDPRAGPRRPPAPVHERPPRPSRPPPGGAAPGRARQPGRDGDGRSVAPRRWSSAKQTLRQRERELAEQRRILAEEYRLLRAQRAAGAPPPVTAGRPARQRAARSTRRVRGPGHG